MKILLSQVNQKIKPYKINKITLSNIVVNLFNKLNKCYEHELSSLIHREQREKRLCEIVHTHCYNQTFTTKKAIKTTLKECLDSKDYDRFGLKLLYGILEIGVNITADNSVLLAKEIDIMNVDPKLEAIAMKVMDKMDLSKNAKKDKYGNIILIIMIIGVILSLIRIIQECNSKQFGVMNKRQRAAKMHEQVKSICISRNWINKWRLRRIIKEKLSSEDYNLYANELRDAILDTGVELSEEESYTLTEAANV